jgi:hypothetical protein
MKIGNKVRMTAENSNWVIGETGTITEILEGGGKVAIAFDGREDDYTAFVGDFEIVEATTFPIGSKVFVPMEKSAAIVVKTFTSSTGEVGYELKFPDGDEGSYLANEVTKIPQLKKRYRLYINGDYFHGGYDSIDQARAEIPSIVAGFSKDDIEKLGGMEWSVQDTEEQEVTIVTAATPEEIEDLLNQQVERELPLPANGFEKDEDAAAYQQKREDRFVELCQNYR